ncbi:MAG: DoxX family protein [Propionibacteriaceae bacterium]|nr:DoxX family protein [Propionibacteriaceae bacterium]
MAKKSPDVVLRPRAPVFGWITVAARVILGGAIMAAGLLKIGNLVVSLQQGVVPESVKAVQAYRLPFPDWMITAIGTAMPIIEIVLGLVIVIGLATRWTAALGGLMMVAYIIVISSAWARGLKIDCGCFGPGGDLTLPGEKPMYWLDILRDIGLLICAVWIVLFPKSPLSIDGWIAGPTTQIEE